MPAVRSRRLASVYGTSPRLALDLGALAPVQTVLGWTAAGQHPILRAVRLLKAYRVIAFHQKLVFRATSPNAVRVLNLTHILILGAHWYPPLPWAEEVEGDVA